MAAEVLSPDAVPVLTNLTGAVTDIDDDPDAPDGLWLLAVDDATDTSVRCTFPTPSGHPIGGAAGQNFKIWVRRSATGGNDPTVNVDLRENGVLVANLVSGTTVTSDTGQLITATWDASSLGTADGSAVQVQVTGVRSGGGPTARRTVEIGAVEWNADVTVAASYDQENRQWFADDAGLASNTALAALNVDPTTLQPDFRAIIRWTMRGTGTNITPTAPQKKLQFRHTPNGGAIGAWTDVPAAGDTTHPVRFFNSANITNNETITQRISTGTYVSGRGCEINPSATLGVPVNNGAHETAWAIEGNPTATTPSGVGDTVRLRTLVDKLQTGSFVATDTTTVTFANITIASAADNLSANGIAAGAPAVGSPAIGQEHALSANGVATSAPAVGSPAIGQEHALAATSVATSAPAVGSPTLAETHALTADSIATSAPAVGSPAIGQEHALAATGVATGAPGVVIDPTVGQEHALSATGVATGAPAVGSPTLAEAGSEDNLSADSIAAGTPAVGSPAIGQEHALVAVDTETPVPAVGSPVIGQDHALSANGIATGAPSVGSPSLGQEHALSAAGIATGAPGIVSDPVAAQVHALIAAAIATAAPGVVADPGLGQEHGLVANGIAAGVPGTVNNPGIGEPGSGGDDLVAVQSITNMKTLARANLR